MIINTELLNVTQVVLIKPWLCSILFLPNGPFHVMLSLEMLKSFCAESHDNVTTRQISSFCKICQCVLCCHASSWVRKWYLLFFLNVNPALLSRTPFVLTLNKAHCSMRCFPCPAFFSGSFSPSCVGCEAPLDLLMLNIRCGPAGGAIILAWAFKYTSFHCVPDYLIRRICTTCSRTDGGEKLQPQPHSFLSLK